ncbi:MAG: carboxypeptidase regulatory-like domain-containing protein [Bacteroidales bacterium]|nr:carboxypeptidase regulatory-like domain-containing protein [Bacteroidales bacterium]
MKNHLHLIAVIALVCLAACTAKEPRGYWDDTSVGTATFSGIVTDTFGQTLEDVEVCFHGTNMAREARLVTFSDWDGSFRIEDVPSNARYVTFSLKGYATIAYTINPKRFTVGDEIVLNPVMEYSQATIRGRVLNAEDGQPMAGVRVDCGLGAVTTDAEGYFEISSLTLKDYTVTYTIADGSTYTREVSLNDFVDYQVTLSDVRLGGGELLPGMRWQQLADAPEWFANNYHGSTGFSGINHWSAGYLSAFEWVGDYRYEAEGCALVNIGEDEEDPNQGQFISYTYGRKHIDAGNKIFNVNLRTHYATAASQAQFGVKVLNLTDGGTKCEDAGRASYASSEYSSFSFDLSRYVGKDVVVAFGIYWTNYNYHVASRRFCFASAAVKGDDALPGTPVSGAEWRGFTRENITSMGLNTGTEFSGSNFTLNNTDGDHGARRVHNPGGEQGFSLWRGTNHLTNSWAYQYVNKEVEPVNEQGYTLKTRSDAAADYYTPDSYIYSRFAITDANDRLHLFIRTFSSANPTVFKVVAVPLATCIAAPLAPVSNNAVSAFESPQGCWSFIHEKGNGNPADYAEFVYDLSAYSGQEVVVAIGVHKGGTRAGEQKLCFWKITMD